MKRRAQLMIAAIVVATFVGAGSARADAPDLKSAGPIAFAPDGVLLAADPQSAAVFAIETGDKKGGDRAKGSVNVEGLDKKLAAQLGTTSDELRVVDLAVNPASGMAYLSLSLGQGPDAKAALAMVRPDGDIKMLDTASLKSSKAALPDAPGPDETDRRGSSRRRESITDIAYVDGKVLVAGLSHEEFASTLRSIPYPFKDVAKGTSVKIYHGAHGRFETDSPVRTFLPYEIGGEPHLLAAYTCTPLVKLPIAQLKPGSHIEGTTIAELGNRNRPLDMVAYRKDGEDFVLIANNSRGIMKLKTATFQEAKGITEHVSGGKAEGVPYTTIAEWKGIEQLDRKDDQHALVVRRTDDGALNLETLPFP
jgi:hypothetical protein